MTPYEQLKESHQITWLTDLDPDAPVKVYVRYPDEVHEEDRDLRKVYIVGLPEGWDLEEKNFVPARIREVPLIDEDGGITKIISVGGPSHPFAEGKFSEMIDACQENQGGAYVHYQYLFLPL